MQFIKRCFFLFIFFPLGGTAQNFDIDWLKSINEKESDFKTGFSKTISVSVAAVNIAAPVTLLTVGLAKHDKQLQKQAACMAGGYVLTAIITQGVKTVVQRERPYIKYPFIINRIVPHGSSFPSGHVASAFYAATSLSLQYPKWYVIAPAAVWVVSTGYSRMYLGVHYPTDVLAGVVIGAGSAWVAYKVQHWMDKKAVAKKATVPPAM